MTAQLTKIRGTDAQAILNFGFGSGPAIVTKNVRQLGIKLPLYQSHGVASKKYIGLAGDAARVFAFPLPPCWWLTSYLQAMHNVQYYSATATCSNPSTAQSPPLAATLMTV